MAKLFGRHRKASGNPMFYSIRTRSRGAKRLRQLLSTPATLVAGGVIVLRPRGLARDRPGLSRARNPAARAQHVRLYHRRNKPGDRRNVQAGREGDHAEVRKIGDPVINGGEAIFAGGTDSAGNPKLRTVYYCDLKKKPTVRSPRSYCKTTTS